MKITHLKRASDYEVKDWLDKKLQLTPYQKDVIYRDEIIRFSPFYFYKMAEDDKPSWLWRLTAPVYLIYFIALVCFMPFKWLLTGKWGYGGKFIDNFHSVWVRNMGF